MGHTAIRCGASAGRGAAGDLFRRFLGHGFRQQRKRRGIARSPARSIELVRQLKRRDLSALWVDQPPNSGERDVRSNAVGDIGTADKHVAVGFLQGTGDCRNVDVA